tara:strand:- start:40608 stop:40748 length:141 start_codon:yes stop_codon:yes gene_type:complete
VKRNDFRSISWPTFIDLKKVKKSAKKSKKMNFKPLILKGKFMVKNA